MNNRSHQGNDGDMMAHPHFHALLLVKPSYFKGQGYINKRIGSKCGRKALRADYLPSVNVKAVKATLDEKDASNSIKQSETLKYSVKPSDLALERDKGAWLHEMTKQVHKMRFIATGGVLKGILKPEDEITTEEMISSSLRKYRTLENREWHFSSSLNIENMFMRQNITNMQTNFSNQIPQKYRLNTKER